jgi:hypothetical protein
VPGCLILNDILEFATTEYIGAKGKPVLAINHAAAVLQERSDQFARLAATLEFDKAKTEVELRFLPNTVCRLLKPGKR